MCLDLSGENYICTKKTTLKHFINENAKHISAREAGLIISANMRIQLLLLEGDLLEFSCCSVFRFETPVWEFSPLLLCTGQLKLWCCSLKKKEKTKQKKRLLLYTTTFGLGFFFSPCLVEGTEFSSNWAWTFKNEWNFKVRNIPTRFRSRRSRHPTLSNDRTPNW